MRVCGLLLAVSLTALATVPTSLNANETVTYQYDELGRLVKTTQTGTINNGVVTELAYDDAGNRTNYEVAGSNGAGDASGTGATGGGTGGGGPTSFSVSDASGVEGGNLSFTINRTGSTTGTNSVNYATTDSTALAGSDYGALSGTVTFTAGQVSKTITAATINNSLPEPTEVFHLNLSAPTGGASVTDPQGAGTISDDGDSANTPPNVVADYLSMQICENAQINVVANDTDSEGNYPLVLLSVSGGSASVVSSTTIGYSSSGAEGSFTVNYVVRDSLGATSTGQLYVTVSGGSCS